MGKYQALHACIAPEHLKVNEKYAFSLNQAFDPNDLQESINHLYKMLNCCDSIAELVLYPEYSPIGRLHYHGYITIMDKYGFYSNDIHMIKKYGSFELDSIAHPDKWMTYCTKNKDMMKDPVLSLKGAIGLTESKKSKYSYPLIYRSVDAIMKRKEKADRWAEHRERDSLLLDDLHLVFDHVIDKAREDD